jgi:hypothetical protein
MQKVGSLETIEHLRKLEERLLDPAVRASSSEAGKLLPDNFREFGSSGKVFDKAKILEELAASPGFYGKYTVTDFSATQLAPDVFLVTYRIVENQTLRSSIWRKFSGDWKMVFHQGTRPDS